jgi:hypothetical protein
MNMQKQLSSYICLLLLLAASCKKDDKNVFNPGAPIVVSDFMPQEGGANTEIIINGSNFTSTVADISVTLNGKPLRVINANTTAILARLPKQAGSGPLVVTIAGKSSTSAGSFNYQYLKTVSTLAGSGEGGFFNARGTAATFNLQAARAGLDVDDQFNVYVADPGNHAIRKISADGVVTTLAGNGNPGHADGKGSGVMFQDPYDVAVDAAHNVYVADRRQLYIRKITPDGTVSTVVKTDTVGGYTHSSAPYGIGVDKKTGTVYYTDWNWDNGSICRILPDGTVSRIITVNKPGDVTPDSDGNLYVTCNTDHVIKRFKANSWEETVIAGTGDPGLANGIGTAAKFESPWGIAADIHNNLYIAGNGNGGGDANTNQCIRFITSGTWDVSTFAGSSTGTAGYQNGAVTEALFDAPTGVAVDKEGMVYVLDRMNNRIRKITIE